MLFESHSGLFANNPEQVSNLPIGLPCVQADSASYSQWDEKLVVAYWPVAC